MKGQGPGLGDQGGREEISDTEKLSRAGRLSYVSEDRTGKLLNKTAEVGRMLNGLRRSIQKKV